MQKFPLQQSPAPQSQEELQAPQVPTQAQAAQAPIRAQAKPISPVPRASSRRRRNGLDRFEQRRNFVILFAMTFVAALFGVLYHAHDFRGLANLSAMDSAQVARHIASGHGFATDFIRPSTPDALAARTPSPDLSNAPAWPFLLAQAFSLGEANDRTVSLLSLAVWIASAALLFALARRLSGNLLLASLSVAALALSNAVLQMSDSGHPLVLAACLLPALLLLLSPDADDFATRIANAAPAQNEAANAQAANVQNNGAQSNGVDSSGAASDGARRGATSDEMQSGGAHLGFGRCAAAGVVAALCVLTEPSLLFFVVPLVWIFGSMMRVWNRRTVSIFVLGFVLMSLPWWIRNARLAGSPFPASQWLEPMMLAPGAKASAGMFVQRAALGLKTLAAALATMPQLLLLPFLLLSPFFDSGRRGVEACKWGVLAALPIYLVAASVLGRGTAPLVLPLAGLLALIGISVFLSLLDGVLTNWANVGAGLSGNAAHLALAGRTKRRRRQPRIRIAALSTLLLLFFAPVAWNLMEPGATQPNGLAQALEPIGKATSPERLIVSDLPFAVAWYGNHRATWIPSGVGGLAALEKRGGVGAIYLSPLMMSYPANGGVRQWQQLFQGASKGSGGLSGFSAPVRRNVGDVVWTRLPTLDQARRLAQSQPKNAAAQNAMAQSLFSLNRQEEALKSFKAAQLLNPEWIEPRLGAARAAFQLKNYALAATNYTEALKIAPHSLRARLGLAEVRLAQNRNPEARNLYEAVLADDPNQPVAMNNLAFLYAADVRDLPRATEMARRALATDPENPAMLDTLGWVFTRSGRARESLAFLREAAKRDPNSALIQSHLGQSLLLNNRKQEAATILRRALLGRLPDKEKAQAQIALKKAGG